MNAPVKSELPEHDPSQVDVDPYSLPLEQIDVANPYLFEADKHWPWFKRLRDEAPVHYCADSVFGPYWGTRVFPSKNDNNRRKPRHPGPPRGDCFF